MKTLLPGITARRIPTSRLTVNVLEIDGREPESPVLFVHGNVSSSLFWQPLMLALPDRYRPIALDLRGFGDTDPEPVDATRGVRDYSDDVAATVAALALPPAHVVGWSLGGGVVLQYLLDAPDADRLTDPGGPGVPVRFRRYRRRRRCAVRPGGTLAPAAASANPGFVAQLAAGDRSADSPLSPRQVLLAHYVKPPFVPEHLDIFVESMLSTRLGEDHYPGDSTTVGVLARHRTRQPGCAQHPGAHPLPARRSDGGRARSRRSCGCGAPTT